MSIAGVGIAAVVAGIGARGVVRGRVGIAPAATALGVVAETLRRLPPRRTPAPAVLGRFQLTYYWMATERRRPRRDDEEVVLRSRSCAPLATVTKAFARNLRLEGTGILHDGRVVNVAGGCTCGAPCYRRAPRAHRFGTGVAERPLAPFRSVAVDSRLVAIGTRLYIPELDGVRMPGRAPWGDFVHDGCVTADDRGGGVRGKQLDLFTVRRAHYKALARRLNARKVTVLDGSAQCAGRPASRAVAARRGGV